MDKKNWKMGGAWVLAGLFGYFTGEFLPPEVFGSLIGAFV